MSSNPCNYIDYGVATIKRQTRVGYGWLVVGQSVGAGLAYGLLAIRLLSDMNSDAAAVVFGLWRYTCVICLCR